MMRALRFVCAAWVLPAGFSLIAFFGFFTNYTTDVFSVGGLAARYETSVFRYRVLGRELVAGVSGWLETLDVAWPVPRALTLFDPAATPATYWAYVIVHVLFVCAGCSVLLATLRRLIDEGPALLVVTVASLLMALGAFVVTPYDGVFFAFQAAGIALTLAPATAAAAAGLAVVTALAMLTRETAAFIPALYLAAHHRAIARGDTARRLALLVSSAAFVLAYAALRTAYGWRRGSVYYAVQGSANLEWTSLVGSTLLLASLVLLLGPGRQRAARVFFATLAVPYIIFVHVFAAPWEWRLWVPILLPLLVLHVIPGAATEHRLAAAHRGATMKPLPPR